MEPQVLETLILIVHVLASLAIIGLVLIQHGKGADMGSGFGGGSSGTVFGSGGAGNFLTKLTTSLAIAFFLYMSTRKQGTDTHDDEDPAQDFSNLELRSVEQAVAGLGEDGWMIAVVFLDGNKGLSIEKVRDYLSRKWPMHSPLGSIDTRGMQKRFSTIAETSSRSSIWAKTAKVTALRSSLSSASLVCQLGCWMKASLTSRLTSSAPTTPASSSVL